ncbi:receptor-like protein EIX2 isoform X4 [Quercus robur]|uniref:receptor-like protein EIX2 isoform X4 n=1 Tax=Quercus robur TaxID=38942 RepID=UPI00216163F5|nr:receptor-like protein EIX2 isoform X4 [Quercus robur]XP_050246638.1 receptor-like protein EIX2 isoform X4 [Quercus robur]XP_050246639.1 receptor-like protein EIX2 isoform X4 [Quercus robur]
MGIVVSGRELSATMLLVTSKNSISEAFLLLCLNIFQLKPNMKLLFNLMHSQCLVDLFVVDGDSVDFERALLVIKGQVLEYTTNLGLLRTIDLSKNNLSGEIPKEVTSLQGLQSLNLSFNNLTGRIPENIGAMGSLESLDFSENQLSGRIPPSMSKLSFLSKLNLSMNNLSGKIPSGTQLQSFSASSFIGNKLCGPPLTDNCTINYAKSNTKDRGRRGGREVDWFYVGMALGFVVGFWIVWGPLLMNRKWRIMYFQFLDRMGYKLGVFWHKLDSFYLNVVRFLSCY